jgi:uncharacterized protein (TIGR00251 family)
MDSEASNLPAYIRPSSDGVILSVKVQPRASSNSIEAPLGNELRIKVAAPPVDSAANDALIRFLSEQLDVPRNRIELLRGHTSRHKQVKIYGVPAKVLVKKLVPTGE